MRFRNLIPGVSILIIAIAVAVILAACRDEINPCGVNPTTTNAAGECIEADGEVCDDDPCDSDDFDDFDDFDKKKSTPKPKATSPKISTTRRR